jgi:hypothetical protein
MGLVDRMREGAEQATSRARESVQEVQVKRDLAHAYGELGRAAFALIERGAIGEETLDLPAARVRELQAQLAALGRGNA